MNATIKVSVCVVTYNQEAYIRQCLDSLVHQDVEFDYEIIVGDDASTDSTAAIIKDYQQRYPGLIYPLFHTVNVGAVKNMIAVYRAARGEYIAHMDGDDIALPQKLRRQALELDSNNDCFYCTHEVIAVNQKSAKVKDKWSNFPEGIYNISTLYLNLPFFTHSSKMFRNDALSKYYDDFHDGTIDIEVHVKHAKKGKIYHINDCLGGYRVFSGVSSISKRINPVIAAGNRRIYEAALHNDVPDLSADEIKLAYAKSLLKLSYQSLYLGCCSDAYLYGIESRGIRKYSFLQDFLICSARFPLTSRFFFKCRIGMKTNLWGLRSWLRNLKKNDSSLS